MKLKDILKSERVCGRYFVFGKFVLFWERYNVDWKFLFNLGKKDYLKEFDLQVVVVRVDRVKDCD